MSGTESNDDIELRGVAMAAFHEHEHSVSPVETEAALEAVRSRIDGGDVGGSSPVLFEEEPTRSGRSPWLVMAAAAAVIAMVGAGLVAVVGSGNPDVVTLATPPPIAETTAVPTSTDVPATTDAVDETVPPTTQTDVTPSAVPAVPQTIAVDAADPPPLVEPSAFAAIPLEPNPNGTRISVGIGPESIVVHQADTTFVSIVDTVPSVGSSRNLEFDGGLSQVRNIEIDDRLWQVVVGPGDVAYGFGEVIVPAEGESLPGPMPIVAIALSGEREGQVVAQELLDTNEWLELPANVLGHGSAGVVGRTRRANETLIEYVDVDGSPLAWLEDAPPLISVETDGGDRLVSVEGGASWNVVVTKDPAHGGSYVGPSPAAPGSDGRVIFSDRIGVDTTPGQDFGPNTMPAIALLQPDGSGSWVRLPDDWDVVASDMWGTVLGREIGGVFELALLGEALAAAGLDDEPSSTVTTLTLPGLPPRTTVPPTPIDDELAIVNNCSVDSQCTLLANTEDGRMVAYDPSVDAFLVYDATGQELQSDVPVVESLALAQPSIEHVGPDDVVYVSMPTPGTTDPSRDLVAIPLIGPNAGTVVMSWTGLDGTGDSTLIPRKAGLVVVGCCGPRVPRPSPDAVIYGYVDRNGSIIESTAPTFRLDLGDAGSNLVRISEDGSSTFFDLPTAVQNPRDFIDVVATDDGGALGTDFDQLTQRTVIVRFRADWPEFGIDNSDVYVVDGDFEFGPVLLEPSGTVIIADGFRFLRRPVGDVATPGWPGTADVGVEAGTVAAPDLNEYVAANQPSWADDPLVYAYQLKQFIGPNESVTIEFDDTTGVLTITTSGLLDDSTAASRMTVQTERADDGLLRFVSGTFGYQCQPGRGHQDFSTERCI